MFATLQKMNLFPYSQLWRIRNEPTSSNNCSVCLSLLIILGIGALLITQLILVFRKETITSTSQVLVDDFPPKTEVSTFANISDPEPLMIGIDIQSGNPEFDTSTLTITSFIDKLQGQSRYNRTQTQTPITLEKCTETHFSTFPNIATYFNTWNASNWLCLPINQRYTIEGSWSLNANYSSIDIIFNCSGSCMNYTKGLNIWFYALSTIANADNKTDPQQHYINEFNIPITPLGYNQYSYTIAENSILTDSSVFPWTNKHTTKSWTAGTIKNELSQQSANSSVIHFYIQRSTKTYVYTRSFYQLIDAFSFIGGTLQAILGFFFFASIIGKIFFEFQFAKKLFRTEEVEDFGAKDFFVQMTYKALSTLKCRPDWREAQQRQKLQKTVNKILDITYLQKRLDFIENALSVILQEHQLEALYLCHNISPDSINLNYKRHHLRDRLICYFSEKKLEEHLKEPFPSERETAHNKTFNVGKAIRRSEQNKENQTPKSTKCLPSAYTQGDRGRKGTKSQIKYQLPVQMSQEMIINDRTSRVQEALQELPEKMRQALKQIGYMSKRKINPQQIREWIFGNYRKLVKDVEQKKDWRSIKIYEGIDKWLKDLLREAIRQDILSDEVLRDSRQIRSSHHLRH